MSNSFAVAELLGVRGGADKRTNVALAEYIQNDLRLRHGGGGDDEEIGFSFM